MRAKKFKYVCIMIECSDVLFSVIYHCPSGSTESFLNFTEKLLDRSLDSHSRTVSVGNFNINVSLDDPCYVCLNELIEAYGCMNVINMPTRITAHLKQCQTYVSQASMLLMSRQVQLLPTLAIIF